MMHKKVVVNSIKLLGIIPLLTSINSQANDVKIEGNLMLDYDAFNSAFLEDGTQSQSNSEIRRARLGLKYDLLNNWKTKFKIDLSNSDIEIKDAYVKYQGFQWADITLGKQKEPFGLEELTSSTNTLMIERSIVTSAIAPGRSLGVNLTGDNNNFFWQLGLFQPENNTQAITGRAIWVPWQKNNNLTHIGYSFSSRDLNDNDYRINEKLEVHSADSLIEGKKLIPNREYLQGVEFLWQQSGFTTQAEWQQSNVTDINNDNYSYEGGYIQFGYQLSGKNRKYKQGKLKSTAIKGWELTTRYSELKLLEEQRKAQIYSIGANYTINKHVKLMADIIHAKHNYSETNDNNALTLRLQYKF